MDLCQLDNILLADKALVKYFLQRIEGPVLYGI
jgi:hypothetical protein